MLAKAIAPCAASLAKSKGAIAFLPSSDRAISRRSHLSAKSKAFCKENK